MIAGYRGSDFKKAYCHPTPRRGMTVQYLLQTLQLERSEPSRSEP